MPNLEIREGWQLLNGHGPKQLTSEKHTDITAAPESPDQDRPEGSAEQPAGRPTTPELPNGNPLRTPRRLEAKSPSSGEAAGPPTPMQPPTATRRDATSPPGRSDEEHPPPKPKLQQTSVSPQRKERQRPVRGNRAPTPAQQPPTARHLDFHQGPHSGHAHYGRVSSPSRDTQHTHDHLRSLHMQEDEQYLINPEMRQDMDEWMRESQAQDMQYYNHGQEYSQEYGGHQEMAWSGNSHVHMPQHHAPAPQPPRQPYPGGPHSPMTFHQGQAPPASLDFPIVQPGIYHNNGMEYIVNYPRKMNGWMGGPAVSHHDPMQSQSHYAPMPHGARYQRACQMMPQDRGYYDNVWVEQQRCMQPAAMEHPAFAPGMHQMAYPQPNLVPINAPMQHFSGGQGSDYSSSYHTRQHSGGSGHRASASSRHQRQISMPDFDDAAWAPANPSQGRGKLFDLPQSPMREGSARGPKASYKRDSLLVGNASTDRPAKAPPDRKQEFPPKPRGHRRHMSLPADLTLARQQGGFPGRRGHRRTQNSRAASMRSSGSGSSHSGRQSPASAGQATPTPDPKPALTLQDVLNDLARMCDNQDGSRQVQALLASATSQEISDFVAGFVEHGQAMEVVMDSFGNYVAQRLIEAAGPDARLAIGRLLAPAMLELSKHQYGCRVVQNAIQGLPTIESKVEMAIQLKGQVVAYVLNSHGNHVVQCCITNIPSAENGHSIEFMLEELRDATLKLSPEALGDRAAPAGEREEAGFVGVAKHGYGCRVVQRIMEHCALSGWKDRICRQVAQHACELAQTSFGNYVIQSCLALCSDEDRDIAYANLMTQVGVLAFHKNASNVYEKLIVATEARRMTPQQLGAFYQRLLRDAGNRAEPGPLLDRLIPHQYGNYIVSSCLALMSREQVATVKAHIEAELRAVEANPKSTKQVKDRVAKLLSKAAASLEQAAANAVDGEQ